MSNQTDNINDIDIIVSENRKLKERLDQLETKLHGLQTAELILNSSQDLIFAVDENLRFVYANPQTIHFGSTAMDCSAEEFIHRSLIDIAESPAMLGSDFAKRKFKIITNLFSDPKSMYLESNVIYKESLVWLGLWLIPVREYTGRVLAVAGIARNITEQKNIQAALAAEKERLAVTLSSVADAVVTANIHGQVVSFNDAAEKLTGRNKNDVSGLHVNDVLSFCSENNRTIVNNPIVSLLDKQLFGPSCYREDLDAVLQTIDGSNIPVSGTTTLIINSNNECLGAVLVLRDMSKQRAAEEEMHRVQKLEAVGILAGGIAHDFNNILTSISGNISLAQIKRDEAFIAARLKDAEKAVLRAQGLTSQLLTFSKGGAPIKTLASVDRIIDDSAAFSLIGSSVRRTVQIPDDLWRVEVDEGQISQVIQNLVINSEQAMPDGGTVYISAENRQIEDESSLPLKPGQYVVIYVKDEGIGIPTCNLDRVFDPYFTTKENGTGLGLATVHSIVRRHGGHITVDSTEGVGTTFSLFLPATEDRPSTEFSSAYPPLEGTGCILVMDDEKTVRDVVCSMIQSLGFSTEWTAGGQEALELYRKRYNNNNPFCAVIVDLTVPGDIGGKEVLPLLKKIDPKAKVIVSSGYFNDPIMSEYKKYGFSERIAKPYGIEQLSRVLRKVLDGKKT